MSTGLHARLASLAVGAAFWAMTAPAGAVPSAPVPPADIPNAPSRGGVVLAQSSADVAQQSMRIDRLEDQMRQMNGRVDEITYSLQQIQEMLRRMQEDNEFRFQQLEGGGKPRKRSDIPAAPSTDDVATLTAPSAGDGAITNGPQDVPADLAAGFSIEPPVDGGTVETGSDGYGAPPQVLGTIPAESGGSGPLDLSAIARGDRSGGQGIYAGETGLPDQGGSLAGPGDVYGGSGAGVTDPAPGLPQAVSSAPLEAPAGATASDGPLSTAGGGGGTEVASLGNAVPEDPRASYDQAYGYVVAGDYDAAERALKKFLADHPKDKLSGSARYWLGETYYARGQYRDAAESFLSTYRDYPKSAKAPDSLLKLGLSLEGLGEKEAACATYREVEKKFPTAGGALVAKVADRKSKAGC